MQEISKMEEKNEQLKIKPYARLLTMLGDQLIKNELIALTELIKNAYDADAEWVKVSFMNFKDDYSATANSKIVIEDDGCGMNKEIILNHWLNPATPDKYNRKKKNPVTSKGRILQGEKGIGRFAIFKLGKKITVTTRRQSQDENGKFIYEGENLENKLEYDFSKYDDDFLSENGNQKDLYLDQLEIGFSETQPTEIVEKEIDLGIKRVNRKPYGTKIEISDIKTKWTAEKVANVLSDISKLQPIFNDTKTSDFGVYIYKDESYQGNQEKYKDKISDYLDNKAVFKIKNGFFNVEKRSFSFELNGEQKEIGFNDQEINGLKRFKTFKEKIEKKEEIECGSFHFEFYLFDFNADSSNPSKYYLTKDDKNIIKEHRIYLYRDGVRVLPYGDPHDDWLGIDIARGVVRAGDYLSNDQVVGCIYITQKDNPNLKDKTNREGLIEEGNALDDFIGIIQLFLQYLRKKPYAQYAIDKEKKKEIEFIKNKKTSQLFEAAKDQYKYSEDIYGLLTDLDETYIAEKTILEKRILKTENLAAVGLSVETASHDFMIILQRAIEQNEAIIEGLEKGNNLINYEELLKKEKLIQDALTTISLYMKDIQLLFPSTKSRKKKIDVSSILNKVSNIYNRAFKDNNITLRFVNFEEPLIAITTDAVLLQVFINLFDNSLYWLKTINKSNKEVVITIDSYQNRVIFSDNGPGIQPDDERYIFEAFYSGKGEEGRGLGLYIAQQLLDRYDYSIRLAKTDEERKLEGANFVISFAKED